MGGRGIEWPCKCRFERLRMGKRGSSQRKLKSTSELVRLVEHID